MTSRQKDGIIKTEKEKEKEKMEQRNYYRTMYRIITQRTWGIDNIVEKELAKALEAYEEQYLKKALDNIQD